MTAGIRVSQCDVKLNDDGMDYRAKICCCFLLRWAGRSLDLYHVALSKKRAFCFIMTRQQWQNIGIGRTRTSRTSCSGGGRGADNINAREFSPRVGWRPPDDVRVSLILSQSTGEFW